MIGATMVSKEALSAMRLRTCAIGVLKSTVNDVVSDPAKPQFKILGTGFLVGPMTVLTNRHVVANVTTYLEKESLPKNRRYVAFIRPELSGIAQTFHEVEKMLMITMPKMFDVGLVSFRANPDDAIRTLSPVEVPEHFVSEVGDAVAVYGYAFGENLLKQDLDTPERTYRFGPILQQGHISAISPFEHAPVVNRVLLDVRTARGMSGAPVFNPYTGSVIAVHNSGIEDTVAFAIPLSTQLIADLLAIPPGSPGDQGTSDASWAKRPPSE